MVCGRRGLRGDDRLQKDLKPLDCLRGVRGAGKNILRGAVDRKVYFQAVCLFAQKGRGRRKAFKEKGRQDCEIYEKEVDCLQEST